MSDNYLKKEFKESDLQRIRNLVKKDFTSSVKTSVGYDKEYVKYSEGDVWEEDGKEWTIQNGIRISITKLDSLKELSKIPLACPKCEGPMNHRLHKKMYHIHGFCFHCTQEYEAELKRAGLYDKYEKSMMSGNIEAFTRDLKNWVDEVIRDDVFYVTEQGDVEEVTFNHENFKKGLLEKLDKYLEKSKSITD